MGRQPRPKSTAKGERNRWRRGEATDQNETPAATLFKILRTCSKLREVLSACARDLGSEELGSGKGIQQPLHLLSIHPSAPSRQEVIGISHRFSRHTTAFTHRSTASFRHISGTDPTRALHEWVIWVLSAHASPCLSEAGTPIFLLGHSPQALVSDPAIHHSITPFHPFLPALPTPRNVPRGTSDALHPNASLYI